MIRFSVFDDAGPARSFALRHAHLVGKEELAVAGTIDFADGLITCKKHSTDAAGLALQIEAGPTGRLTLQTCLLPDRPDPYLLDLELARHRIMLLLNKIEEWAWSDLAADHPVMLGFEKARALFTQSLIAPRGRTGAWTPEQATLARQSLILGIETGERLSLLEAERSLAERLTSPPKAETEASTIDVDLTDLPAEEPARPLLGCTVHTDQFAEPLQKIVSRHFDLLSVPLRWAELEKDEGQHSFAPTDRWVEWAVRTAKIPVAGGPLIDFSARALPKWLYIWENDYKTLRELTYEHLKTVVTRYRRAISRWIVASGLNVNSEISLRIEEMIDLTRLAVLTVRKLQPTATVIIEINQPWGEHVTHLDRSIAPLLYATLVKEQGIAFDGLSLRIQMGDTESGRSTRDLMALSAVLDTFASLEKPIHVTALGAPSAALKPAPAAAPAGKHNGPPPEWCADPGYWRQPWSATQQAEWLTQAVSIAMSKPLVQSVCWQALFDSDVSPEMRFGGLISSKGEAKPSLKRIGDVAASLRSRASPTTLPPVEAEARA